MRLVEQTIIRKDDPRYAAIDAAAFASKNLYYQASDKCLIHADVNGSYNIARKVFPTAFGPGIAASYAVRPRRLAV